MKNTINSILLLSMALFGVGSVVTTAQAKTHAHAHYRSVKVLKAHKTALRHVKVVNTNSHAFLYTSSSLKNKVDYVHNYAGQKGVTTYNVKLRLKSGKVATYTRVRNLGGPNKGVYVNSAYVKTVKASTSKKSATKTPATPTKKTPAKSDSSSTSTKANPNVGYHGKFTSDGNLAYDSKSYINALPVSQYSVAKYRDEMLYEINTLREAKGLKPLVEDSFLDQVAQMRSNDEMSDYNNGGSGSHYTSTGALKNNIDANKIKGTTNVSYPMAECITGSTIATDDNVSGVVNSYDAANQEFQNYVYGDSGSNWGHRNIILSKNYNKIGIGETFDGKTALTSNALEFQ